MNDATTKNVFAQQYDSNANTYSQPTLLAVPSRAYLKFINSQNTIAELFCISTLASGHIVMNLYNTLIKMSCWAERNQQ